MEQGTYSFTIPSGGQQQQQQPQQPQQQVVYAQPQQVSLSGIKSCFCLFVILLGMSNLKNLLSCQVVYTTPQQRVVYSQQQQQQVYQVAPTHSQQVLKAVRLTLS